MSEHGFYTLLASAAAAIGIIALASLASYLDEVKNELKKPGKTVAEVFSLARLGITFGIAFFIGVLGMAIAGIVVDIVFPEMKQWRQYTIAVVAGAAAGFFHQLSIMLMRQKIPEVLECIISRITPK